MEGAIFIKLDILILMAIAGKGIDETWGLEIQRNIEAATENTVLINNGSLYTYLQRLEKQKYVKSRIEANNESDRKGVRRKYYKIEQKGLDLLDEIALVSVRLHSPQPNGFY